MPTKHKAPLPGGVDLDDVARRYFSEKQRTSMSAEDFGDPTNKKFPVKNQEDLENAARLVGHAADPDAVKRRLIDIAKRKGLALPASWQVEEAAKTTQRAATPDQPVDGNDDGDAAGEHSDGRSADELVDDLTGNNQPNAGADGPDDQADEAGDENLQPSAVGGRAAEASIERALPAPDVSYYAPITRINREKREIIGVATAEVKDAYRTVIGYEASKDAFQRWRGNIREMHDPKKAVGRALEIIPDDEHKRIVVRARISKGAEDTWQKVLDGTLTGFSIGGHNGKWTKRMIDGEELPYLERYDQAELSVVDNPACPAATIEVVRADGLASDILAKDEEMPTKSKHTPPPLDETTVERAGARLSKETMDAMHMARDHAKNAMSQTCATCGCDDCSDHLSKLNQIGQHDDNDGDIDANALASMRHLVGEVVRETIAEALREQVAPVIARVNALLASDAQRSDESPEITRRVDDVAAQLAAIKALVEQIAAQPADGGPVLHGAASPVEKVLATNGARGGAAATDAAAIQRALALGFAPPTELKDQLKAAAALMPR